MVAYNKKERKLTIVVERVEIEQIPEFQKAIIFFIQNFSQHGNYGPAYENGKCYLLSLLEATMPTAEQLENNNLIFNE